MEKKVNKREHINELLPDYWEFSVSLRATFVIPELDFLMWKGVFRPLVLSCVYFIILLYYSLFLFYHVQITVSQYMLP